MSARARAVRGLETLEIAFPLEKGPLFRPGALLRSRSRSRKGHLPPKSASRAPRERPRPPQERPRAPQERPKSSQESLKSAQERPKSAPRAAKSAPRAPKRAPRAPHERVPKNYIEARAASRARAAARASASRARAASSDQFCCVSKSSQLHGFITDRLTDQ